MKHVTTGLAEVVVGFMKNFTCLADRRPALVPMVLDGLRDYFIWSADEHADLTFQQLAHVCRATDHSKGIIHKLAPPGWVVDTAHIACSRVYVTVQCPSVCLSHLSTAAAACGEFAAGVQQQMRAVSRLQLP